VNSRQVTDSAAAFVDLIDQGAICHTGDPRWGFALEGLARRQRGDRWAFDRYEGHPSPIIAAALACWVAAEPVLQVGLW
jgi:hypothetical protein